MVSEAECHYISKNNVWFSATLKNNMQEYLNLVTARFVNDFIGCKTTTRYNHGKPYGSVCKINTIVLVTPSVNPGTEPDARQARVDASI